MTLLRYLIAVVLGAAAFGPVILGARAWRRRLLPELDGAPALLVTAILAISAVVIVSEILGIFGGLRVAILTVGLAAAGGGAWYLAHPREAWLLAVTTASSGSGTRRHEPSGGVPGTSVRVLALIATSVVTAEWMTRTVDALHHGITTIDSLWYHMPFAARFVQQGSIIHLHYVDTEPLVPFYPANSELLHAVGIAFVSNDFLSPMLNLGWMALVLLAAWCVGRPFGVGPISLIGACVLLGTPGLVATQPGGGYNDIVGLALFLAAIAVLTSSVRDRDQLQLPGIAIAAMAAGLAAGTKYTLVGPVAILMVGTWVVCRRGQRLRAIGLWSVLTVLTGGFWYAKDWVATGNPLPSLSRLGPWKLSSPPMAAPNMSISHYLLDWGIWRRFFVPGIRSALGPASWAIFACSAVGLLFLLLSGRSALYRMIAIVGVGSAIVFIYTPQLLGPPGSPVYFVYNLRYGAPAVLVGLVVLPLARPLRRQRVRFWVGLGLVVILAITQLDSTIWPLHLFAGEFGPPVRGLDSWIGLAIGVLVLVGVPALWYVRGDQIRWRHGPVLVVGALVVLLCLGYPLQRLYLKDRYTTAGVGSIVAPEVVRWAQGLSDQRIAVDGPLMMLQYQYYGKESSNYVQYLERVLPDGRMEQYNSCPQWLAALDGGRYDYLITSTPVEQRWAHGDPKARVVISEDRAPGYSVDVFKLAPGISASACRGTGTSPIMPRGDSAKSET